MISNASVSQAKLMPASGSGNSLELGPGASSKANSPIMQRLKTDRRNPMELTITESGALYVLQHGATKKYRRLHPRRVGANLIRILPTLTSIKKRLALRPVPAETAQSMPQNTGAQVVDAFPEYRVAA
jgi:hypothetical protein